MNAKTKALVDPRPAAQILRELQTISPGFVPEWLPTSKSMDEALLRIFVRYIETMLQRLNQAPDKNFMAFLETFGVRRLPARSARAPIVFQVAELAEDGRIPRGTKLGAAPPPGQGDQIIFETEKAVGLASAKLVQAVSLNPGRDEFKDHTEALLKGEPFTIFSDMQPTEHVLYLAHQRLLALVGKTSLRVFFDLQTGSDERLDLTWEYWDGKVWRTFRNVLEQCDQSADQDLDSTDGLTRSGRFVLETDCAETQKTIINGIESYWIRARLLEPLPVDPAQALPLVDTIKMQTVVARNIVSTSNENVTAKIDIRMDNYPDPDHPSIMSFILTGSKTGAIERARITGTLSLLSQNNQIVKNFESLTDKDGKTVDPIILSPPAPELPKIADIFVDPPFHDFGNVPINAEKSRQFIIKNTGDKELTVEPSLNEKDEWAWRGDSRFTIGLKAQKEITVLFQPKSKGTTKGSKEAMLRLTSGSDDPDEKPLEVKLIGYAIAPQIIVHTVEPDAQDQKIDFGPVEIKGSSIKLFVVQNAGDADLTLNRLPEVIGADKADFPTIKMNPVDLKLQPGETREVEVTFTPLSASDKNVSLKIESNAPGQTELALKGKGVPPQPQNLVISPTTAFSHHFVQEQGSTSFKALDFTITNKGKVDLKVKELKKSKVDEKDPEAFLNEFEYEVIKLQPGQTSFILGPEKSQGILVRFNPKSPGFKRAKLIIESDDPDYSALNPLALFLRGTNPLKSTVPESISIELDQSDLGYAPLRIDSTRMGTITITNNGNNLISGFLTLIDLQSNQETTDFRFLNDLKSFSDLANGDPRNFTIVFKPETPGVKNVKVQLTLITNAVRKASKARSEARTVHDIAVVSGIGVDKLVPKVIALPAKHDFGPAAVKAQSATKTFVLRNDGYDGFKATVDGTPLKEFVLKSGKGEIGSDQTKGLQPYELHIIEVGFAPNSGAPKTETLTIASQNKPDQADIILVFQGTGMDAPKPEMIIAPDPLEFGSAAQETTRALKIWKGGNADLAGKVETPLGDHLALFKITQGLGDFSVNQSNSPHTVEVKFVPDGNIGEKNATLPITSNDRKRERIAIKLHGEVAPQPQPKISVTPESIAFKGVWRGTTGISQTLIIRNVGNADLKIKAVQLAEGEATIFSTNFDPNNNPDLKPGGYRPIEISFKPGSLGEKKALLQIDTNVPDNNGVKQISLNGVGEKAPARAWQVDFAASFSVHHIFFEPVDFSEEEGINPPGKHFEKTEPTGKIENFTPDLAFANAEEVDLTTIFYPYGLFVLPGSTFYFSSEEVFSKPGARTTISLIVVPNSNVASGAGVNVISHKVIWEYWNGREWTELSAKFEASGAPEDTDKSKEVTALNLDGTISFTVPQDMNKTTVNDKEAFWVRVRVLTGGFGITRDVAYEVKPDPNKDAVINYLKISEPSPPAISEFALGYAYESPKEFFDHCLALNDFRHLNHSIAARTSGQFFPPFQRLSDNLPALYIGFDKKLPTDFLQIFFNLEELDRDDENPALLWEYWDGAQWRETLVEDETGHLQRPGMVSFIGQNDAQFLERFGTPRHWLRARLREDGPTEPSRVLGLFHNAVWAGQRQRIQNEIIGESNGRGNQSFRLRQFPVLDGESVEVRELAEPLAHVEYPILKEKLGEENLRAVRNAEGRVTEVWVRWQYRPHFFFSGPEDRHYTLERAGGRIFFGDDARGKTPPLNAAIMVREYATGGGKIGNVRENAVAQLLGGVPGVQAVFNPLPAEGGAESELPERILARGPLSLRHRERALTVRDYDIMAREASSEVAWVRVFQNTDASLTGKAGHVTIMILPESLAPRPQPSFGLRQRVKEYIEQRGPATLLLGAGVHVTGPEYFEVGVEATVVPINFSEAGFVVERVRKALEEFLHPLRGGPQNTGWELGRDVFLSDVAALIEKTPGVDFVETLHLQRDGAPQGERVAVPEQRLVVAGEINIKAQIVK